MNRREFMGSILKDERNRKGLTVKEMGAKVGISPATISNLERGLPNVTEEKYLIYAKGCGLEKKLFGIVDEIEKREVKALQELYEIEEAIFANPVKALEKINQLNDIIDLEANKTLAPMMHYLYGRYYFELRLKNNERMLKKAREHFQIAIELINKMDQPDDSNLKVACLNELSRTAYFQNEIAEALSLTELGLESFVAEGGRKLYHFHLLLNRVIYLDRLEQVEEAHLAVQELWDQIHTYAETNVVFEVTLDIVIQAYMMYASVLNDLNMPKSALEYAKKGVFIAQKNKCYDRVLTLRTHLGSIYSKLGDNGQAEKCHLLALELEEKIESWQEYLLIFSYLQLGVLYTRQEKWQPAQSMLEKAAQISIKNDDALYSIESFRSLGDCLTKQGLFQQAITSYAEAEKLLRTNDFPSKLHEVEVSMGYCYRQLGNTEKFEYYKNKSFQAEIERWRDNI